MTLSLVEDIHCAFYPPPKGPGSKSHSEVEFPPPPHKGDEMSTLQALETPKSYLTRAPPLQGHRTDTDLGCCFSVVPPGLVFKVCLWFALLYFGDRVSYFIAQVVFELPILVPLRSRGYGPMILCLFFFF